MKPETRSKLEEALKYCDDNEKSTAFTIQYLQDYANVGLDCEIIKSSRSSRFHYFFDLDFICETQTNSPVNPFLKFEAANPNEKPAIKIITFEFPTDLVNTSSNIEEEINIKSIADIMLSKIEEFQKQGKKLDSIKEAHQLFEDLLSNPSFDLADQILKQSINKNFTLAILIAFLTCTLNFKHELNNRQLVFNKAESLALSELGQEKLSASFFNLLK